MKRKIILSLAIVILSFASVGGATMAWFTDEVELTNTFTAGTLTIDGSDHWKSQKPGIDWLNVNPGDRRAKVFTIENKGTKNVLLRVSMDGAWRDMPQGDPDLVTITAPKGWKSKVDEKGTTWWYLDRRIEPGAKHTFELDVSVDGKKTGNEYQGKSFKLNFAFEAIQASNNASEDLWGIKSIYEPHDQMTAANWRRFDPADLP